MESALFNFYSQPSPSSSVTGRHFKTRGLLGSITRFAIPLLRAVIPVVIDSVSDYFTKDISFTRALANNVTINKLKRKLTIYSRQHGQHYRRKIRARSV